METRSRKRKEQPSNTAAANTSKSNKRGRKSEAAEAVEPSKRACQQGRASKRDTKTAAAVSPRATSQSTKEAKRSAATGKDKKQEAQPAKMDSSSRRLRSENEDDMMDDDHVRWGGCALQLQLLGCDMARQECTLWAHTGRHGCTAVGTLCRRHQQVGWGGCVAGRCTGKHSRLHPLSTVHCKGCCANWALGWMMCFPGSRALMGLDSG